MENNEVVYTDAQMLRIKAEELLQEKQQQKKVDLIETDLKKLLHELQVHQIELEMQNEELQQANEIAESALKKYTLLYDLAPMGYFTLDRDANINELNFTGSHMLGDRHFSLINSNFKLFVADESKIVFNDFFNRAYDSNSKEYCEVLLAYDKNPLCYVYMEGIVIGEDWKCMLSVFDITNFKQVKDK
jgi:PAS domain-containing protein